MVADMSLVGFSVGKGRMVFSMQDGRGNIWMTKYGGE